MLHWKWFRGPQFFLLSSKYPCNQPVPKSVPEFRPKFRAKNRAQTPCNNQCSQKVKGREREGVRKHILSKKALLCSKDVFRRKKAF